MSYWILRFNSLWVQDETRLIDVEGFEILCSVGCLEFLFVPNKEKWNFLNVNLFQRRHGKLRGYKWPRRLKGPEQADWVPDFMINIFYMRVPVLLPADCQLRNRNLQGPQSYLYIATRNAFVIRKNGALNPNTDGANSPALRKKSFTFLTFELHDDYNKNENNDNSNKKGDTALEFVHLCWWVRGLLGLIDRYVYRICHYGRSIIRVRSESGIK